MGSNARFFLCTVYSNKGIGLGLYEVLPKYSARCIGKLSNRISDRINELSLNMGKSSRGINQSSTVPVHTKSNACKEI